MVTVRLAGAADADAIGRVQVESWRAAYTGLMPQDVVDEFDVAGRQALWREWLGAPAAPRRANFVVEESGEVIGFASVGPSGDAPGDGELFAIYLHTSRWGSGIGRALLERAEDALRAFGFRAAILYVLEGNERAARFYRTAGWEEDGGKVDEFQGATVTEARYRKRL